MMSVCVRILNNSPARCGDVPGPADAKLKSPGLALAAAMTSCSDL